MSTGAREHTQSTAQPESWSNREFNKCLPAATRANTESRRRKLVAIGSASRAEWLAAALSATLSATPSAMVVVASSNVRWGIAARSGSVSAS